LVDAATTHLRHSSSPAVPFETAARGIES
jgi:hypothetical protein